jgi:hypothetical protein
LLPKRQAPEDSAIPMAGLVEGRLAILNIGLSYEDVNQNFHANIY